MKNVLLLGASGLVGSHVLDALLKDPECASVELWLRRVLPVEHPKVKQSLVNFERPDLFPNMSAEAVLCCLGTTIKKAGSQENFWKVDHDFVIEVAKKARADGAKSFGFVSSIGADAHSRNFYFRCKGKTEDDLAGLGFSKLSILRPSLLLGHRKEFRLAEHALGRVGRIVAPLFVGPLKKYKPVEAEAVAAELVKSV